MNNVSTDLRNLNESLNLFQSEENLLGRRKFSSNFPKHNITFFDNFSSRLDRFLFHSFHGKTHYLKSLGILKSSIPGCRWDVKKKLKFYETPNHFPPFSNLNLNIEITYKTRKPTSYDIWKNSWSYGKILQMALDARHIFKQIAGVVVFFLIKFNEKFTYQLWYVYTFVDGEK